MNIYHVIMELYNLAIGTFGLIRAITSFVHNSTIEKFRCQRDIFSNSAISLNNASPKSNRLIEIHEVGNYIIHCLLKSTSLATTRHISKNDGHIGFLVDPLQRRSREKKTIGTGDHQNI